MAFYLLNSPVLSHWGSYVFEGPLPLAAARAQLPNDFISAIGHDATAALLGSLLQRPVAVNRTRVVMQPGESALVLRLKERPAEGAILDLAQLESAGYEFGLLRRTA